MPKSFCLEIMKKCANSTTAAKNVKYEPTFIVPT